MSTLLNLAKKLRKDIDTGVANIKNSSVAKFTQNRVIPTIQKLDTDQRMPGLQFNPQQALTKPISRFAKGFTQDSADFLGGAKENIVNTPKFLANVATGKTKIVPSSQVGNYQRDPYAVKAQQGANKAFGSGVDPNTGKFKVTGSGAPGVALSAAGLLYPGAKVAMATGAGMNVLASKFTKEDPMEAAGKGASFGLKANAFSGVTNPYISKVINKIPAKIPVKFTNRVAPAVANVAQGVGMDIATGQKTTPISMAMDAAIGIKGGKSQFSSNVKLDDILKKGEALGFKEISPRVNTIHQDDLTVMRRFYDAVVSNKVGKEDLGQLGRDAQAIAEHYFGKKWANLSNKKLADLFAWGIDLNEHLPRDARSPLPKMGIIGENKSSAISSGSVDYNDPKIQKLEHLLNDSSRLLNMGYKKNQVDRINVKEARNIIENQISPLDYDLKPKTKLLKKADELEAQAQFKLEQSRAEAEMSSTERSLYSESVLDQINKLKKYSRSKAFQEGDIETLRKQTPQGLVDHVIESVREAKLDENITDEEALDIALSIPSKTNTRVKMPDEILEARDLRKQAKILSDLVFNSETDLATRQKAREGLKKATQEAMSSDYKDWENQLFKQAGAKKVDDWDVKKLSDIVVDQFTQERTIKNKVSIFDYLRTPDRVLKKIGLEREAKQLRTKYQDYIQDLPREIDQVNQWVKEVGNSKESSRQIFRYLDGQGATLNKTELKVANEMQAYLAGWADKLGLPRDKRVAHYITHIFEQDFIEKEFDPELERLIAGKVPGSVYDPFLQQRLGGKGYIEDAFRAMDAYVKRATRKYHMDQALSDLKVASEGLDQQSWKYVKSYADRVNMRPMEIDNLLDTGIKQIFGYKLGQRPTANLTRKVRTAIYRATLGLNVKSALRNLTQGTNTYAKLGEKYTGIGYARSLRNLFSNDGELEKVGVLSDTLIQDRNRSSMKRVSEKMDDVLFSLFGTVEKINRGAAYYGAKARALDAGLSEKQAIQAGIDTARDTQFTFGAVDTPLALQGDLAKTLLQFQSFSIKQGEFLGEMVQNKEFGGLARWIGSNLLVIGVAGDLLGIGPADLIPSVRIGGSPLFNTAKDLIARKDQYGNEITPEERLEQLGKNLVSFIPAGIQGKKTFGGTRDYSRGYSESSGGRIRFPVKKTPQNLVRGAVMGPWAFPEARAYFDEKRSPLGDKQSEAFKMMPEDQRDQFYSSVIQKRAMDDKKEEIKNQISGEKQSGFFQKLFNKQPEQATPDMLNSYFGVDKYNLLPEDNAFNRAKKEGERKKLISDVLSDADILPEQKINVLNNLGEELDTVDIDYYQVAKLDNSIKLGYIKDYISSTPENERYESLALLTQEVNGQRILAPGVIDDLVDEGLLTKKEGRVLKSVTYDKKTKQLVEKSGSKKGKKANIKGTTPSAKIPNVAPVKASISVGKINLPSVRVSMPTKSPKLLGEGNKDQLIALSKVNKKPISFDKNKVRVRLPKT